MVRHRASCIRRRVMAKSITFIGLDVHKDTIAVALAEAGLRGEVREHGKIPNAAAALKALAMKLASAGRELRFCYEAGPCGYGIQRQLAGMRHDCTVVAPSLIPRKPGERIKTDRRDAINLAKLHRAGELTPVWVPDQAHGDPRSGPCASGGGAHSATSPPAIVRLPAAPRLPLPSAGLDAVAPTMAGQSQVRAGCASYRARRLHRGGRGGDGTTRPPGGTYRGSIAGVGSGAGSTSAASTARRGFGGSSHTAGRTRRHHSLYQSPPTHGLSRPGTVGAFQWPHPPPGRDYQGRQWSSPSDADRGGMELSFSGADQPRAAVAAGASRQADP